MERRISSKKFSDVEEHGAFFKVWEVLALYVVQNINTRQINTYLVQKEDHFVK